MSQAKLLIALALSLGLIAGAVSWAPAAGARESYSPPITPPSKWQAYEYPLRSCTIKRLETWATWRRPLKFSFIMSGMANSYAFHVRQLRYKLTPSNRLSKSNKISIYHQRPGGQAREIYRYQAMVRNNKWQKVNTNFSLPRDTKLYFQAFFDIPVIKDVSCKPKSFVVGRLPRR